MNVDQLGPNFPDEVGNVAAEMVLDKSSQRAIRVEDALIIEKLVGGKGNCRPRVCCLIVLDSPYLYDYTSSCKFQ